jgi:O-antigen ligase
MSTETTLHRADWIAVGLIAASSLLVSVSLPMMHALHLLAGAIMLLITVRFNRQLFFFGAYTTILFVIYNKPGFDLYEFSYYFFSLLFVLRVLLPDILMGKIKMDSTIDKLFVSLFLLSLFHIGTGYIFGGNLFRSVQEFTFYYSPLLFYMFIRDHTHERVFRNWFIGISYTILGYTIFRSFFDYYTKLLRATADWEFGVIRGAGNENVLLFGAFLSFFFFIHMTSKWIRAFHLSVFTLCVLGLLITLTRSVWIGFAFGIMVAFFFGDRFIRIRTTAYLVTIVVGILTVSAIFFLDYLLFAWEIVQIRFQFLSSNTLDMSFVDRLYESQAVLEYIRRNPILGYGHGVEYLRYDVFFGHTKNPSTFIHNGYLAVYFKFGLIGLLLFLALFVTMIRQSIILFRNATEPWVRALTITFVAYLCTALLINLVTPVFLFFEGIFLMSIIAGLISMLSLQMPKPSPG